MKENTNKPTMRVKVDGILEEREYYYDYSEGTPLSICPKIPIINENEHLEMTITGIPEITTLRK